MIRDVHLGALCKVWTYDVMLKSDKMSSLLGLLGLELPEEHLVHIQAFSLIKEFYLDVQCNPLI